MVQRIKGFVGVAYSYIRLLLAIIGWEGIMISLLIGAVLGFIVGYKLGLDDFFGHIPPSTPPVAGV